MSRQCEYVPYRLGDHRGLLFGDAMSVGRDDGSPRIAESDKIRLFLRPELLHRASWPACATFERQAVANDDHRNLEPCDWLVEPGSRL